MKVNILCNTHKAKHVEAVCLNLDCEENPLSCFDCRGLHQDHQIHYVHMIDFIQSLNKSYNISYITHQFNGQINKLKGLQSELENELNKHKVRVISMVDQIYHQCKSSIDSQIESLTNQYKPYHEMMQNLLTLNSSYAHKIDEKVFHKAKESFRVIHKSRNYSLQSSQIHQSSITKNIDFEFLPLEHISSQIQQTQVNFRQITENISKYFENFEVLWKDQVDIINSRETTSTAVSLNQKKSSLLEQQRSSMIIQSNYLADMANRVNQEKIKEEIYKGSFRQNNRQSERNNDVFEDVSKSLSVKRSYKDEEMINKVENNDNVIWTNNPKIEQSPQLKFLENTNPKFGNIQQSILLPPQSVQESVTQLRKEGDQQLFQNIRTQNNHQNHLNGLFQQINNNINNQKGSNPFKSEEEYTFRNENPSQMKGTLFNTRSSSGKQPQITDSKQSESQRLQKQKESHQNAILFQNTQPQVIRNSQGMNESLKQNE